MNIIIEGPDGVGKSTLVKKLKEHYNIDSIRMSYKDPKDFDFYNRLLEKTDCIFDRQFLSELVYPDIFNRKCQLNDENTKLLISKTKELNIKIFILDCDLNEIYARLITRGGEHINILDNLELLKIRFIQIAKEFNIEVIDTTKVSFEDIIRKVENYEKN